MKIHSKILIPLGIVAIVLVAGVLVFNKSSDTPDFFANLIEKVNKVVEAKEDKPVFISGSIEPKKVAPGDEVIVTVEIKDNYGIEKVIADMGGIETIRLQVTGDRLEEFPKQGIWQGKWIAHGTEVKNYQTTVLAVNILGKQATMSLNWEDPTITDTFENEDYIESYENLVVSGGQVKFPTAVGTEQVIFGGYYDLLHISTTQYNSLVSGYNWDSTEAERYKLVSTGGKIKNLRVKLSGSPGAGMHYVFTLMVDGVPSALTVDITDAATSGADTTHEVDVVAGQTVSLQCNPSGIFPTGRYATWTTMFEGSTAKESLILGGSFDALSTSGTEYLSTMCAYDEWSDTENDHRQVCPTAGKIKNLYVKLSEDPGGGDDAYTFTLRVNGASSDLTVTINVPDTTGNNTVNEVTVAAGDILTMMCEEISTPVGPFAVWGMTFEADTDGESIILAGSTQVLPSGMTRYSLLLANFDYIWERDDDEVLAYQLGQECTLKKWYILLDDPPSSGDDYIFTLRINGGDGNLTITISDSATTGNDLVNTDAISDDDYVNLEVQPISSPDQVAAYWGLVCYIEPPDVSLGTLTSTNLLDGETVSSIDSFGYNTSSIPPGTYLKTQFSDDDTNWKDSAGTADGWDTQSEGPDSIDLSGLGWSGDNFYYKERFESTQADTVGLWHFDEGSGTSTADSSGNGNDGSLKPTGTKILRPSANGDVIQLSTSDSATNYENVNEESPDGNTTYNYVNNGGKRDLYGLPDHTTESGAINFVKVYIVSRYSAIIGFAYVKIKTHDTEYTGDEETLTGSYVEYSKQWNDNPHESAAWTWDEIDALQAGVYLSSIVVARCTQVYVEVDYTASPPTWKSGADCKFGSCLEFDGTDDYVSVDDSASLDIPNTITQEAWIKCDDTPTADEYIIYRYNNYYLKINSSRQIVGGVYGAAWATATSSAITCDGSTWTHVAMTYDKDAGGTTEIKMYINGSADGTGDYNTAIPASDKKLYLGAGDEAGDNTPEKTFDGTIEEVRILDVALTAEQIAADHAAGKGFFDGGGTPVLDEISCDFTSWIPRPPGISPSGGGFLIF